MFVRGTVLSLPAKSAPVKTIDHYDVSDTRTELFEREELATKLLRPFLSRGMKVLDLGCGDGTYLDALGQVQPGLDLFGIDFSHDRIALAKNKSLALKQGDLHEGISFAPGFFDIVYTAEVIEHLWDPDAFVKEIVRVLAPGGKLLLTTPNLCAWYNRALFLFGIQPLFVEASTVDSRIGSGVLKRFKNQTRPAGHVRIFNQDALVDILEAYGLRVLKLRGACFERFPWPLRTVDRWVANFPSLTSDFVVLAEKI